jgi:hypothetical protein
VKPTQKCTVITWSSTVFDVSAQYELFSMIKYNKIVAYTRTIKTVFTEQKIVHCVTDNGLDLHEAIYTNTYYDTDW